MAIHGLYMGVILTTYKSWSDPSSRPYQVCRTARELPHLEEFGGAHFGSLNLPKNSPRCKPAQLEKGDEPNVEKSLVFLFRVQNSIFAGVASSDSNNTKDPENLRGPTPQRQGNKALITPKGSKTNKVVNSPLTRPYFLSPKWG